MTLKYVQAGVFVVLLIACGVAFVKLELWQAPTVNSLHEVERETSTQRADSSTENANPATPERPRNPFVSARRGGRDSSIALSPQAAVEQVAGEIYEAMLDGPTLAVWLVDRTASAEKMRAQSLAELKNIYRRIYASPAQGSPQTVNVASQLKTVVGQFAGDVEFLCEPSNNEQAVQSALDSVSIAAGHEERPLTAVKAALERFGRFRKPGQPLFITVITDEAGSDGELVDALAQQVGKLAIAVFVVGDPAVFGRSSAMYSGGMEDGQPTVHGPETLRGELVAIEDFRVTLDAGRMFSGFGPFALERLCRAGSGRYLVAWTESAANAVRFAPEAMARYAPDYVSKADYDQLVAENGARKALLSAAELPALDVATGLEMRFGKRDEADLKRKLDMAQRPAAIFANKLEPLYEKLAAGEKARETLSGARWQAAYDLGMGRVLATRVRFNGYNTALAALKQGRAFPDPTHTSWVLRATPTTSGDSSLEKQAARARMYLERVVKEHPGTPWALLASRELEAGLGWEWTSD